MYLLIVVLGVAVRRNVFTYTGPDGPSAEFWAPMIIAILVGVGGAALSAFSRLPHHAFPLRAFGVQRFVLGMPGVVGMVFSAAVVARTIQEDVNRWDLLLRVTCTVAAVSAAVIVSGLVVSIAVKVWIRQISRDGSAAEYRAAPVPRLAAMYLAVGVIGTASTVGMLIAGFNPASQWEHNLGLILGAMAGGLGFAGAAPVIHTACLYSPRDELNRNAKVFARCLGWWAIILMVFSVVVLARYGLDGVDPRPDKDRSPASCCAKAKG